VVVDRLEGDALGSPPAYEPFGAAVVDLALGMVLHDRPLDIGCIEPTLPETIFGMLSPNEALDSHR
jgi:hypothetical protein